ncbi:tetratricopeptide repeat protein [Chitinophaga nivalis]|uniref:Tetratricopeptide repeat protein n=1 Tax=Chitinophaga nivalis TaxID=2991709 RepID=A0ABT3IWR9_9BACT|nr:tetratricopeptide repeat protein [Chitinophaga nivalis]MCW3461910.1 tetratricopeptide repeat protein [Chitinophaga nivalis]MCW3488399.1 tetratricopeptide repeat protein [Chitinophaga nivalis]
MMKKLPACIFVYALLLVCMRAAAQEQLSVEKRADIHYQREEYARAAGLYEKLLRARQGRRQATFIRQRLADSYRGFNQYEKAAYWYGQLLQDSTGAADNRLYYGDMLKSTGQYAAARQQYQLYPDAQRVAARIAGCEVAPAWLAAPLPVSLHNLQGLNSHENDWGAVWYKDKIVFVSDSLRDDMWFVKGSRHNYGRNNAAFGKLYAAENKTATPGYVKNFAAVINNYPFHVGPVCFTTAGDTAYVTVTNPQRKVPYQKKDRPVYGVRKLELLIFVQKNNQWQSPVAFPYNGNDYSTGHAALNKAGNILYFASDRPGGAGATDIWYSEKQADNSWGTPVNCGVLNTPDEEAFPVINNADELYFSSKGLVGMGGYDIFRATGSRQSWAAPVNLRTPFNSAGDDFYYVQQDDKGFIASNRAGGRGGDDIYRFTTPAAIPGLLPPVLPLLRIPLELDICVPAVTCVYLYNKTRDMGWCYLLSPPSDKIVAKLEPDAEYVVRVHYANRTDSLVFDTRHVADTATLYKTFCPRQINAPAIQREETRIPVKSKPRKH